MIGVADFWRRWHISLSTWLHDYVFAPLGGYQRRKLRTTFNIMLTMTLCGLWHGPTLNFLIFGALNGAYVTFEYLIRRTWLHRLALWRTLPGKAALWALTFFLLTFTLIFFRAQNFDHATSIAASMFALGRSYTSHLSDADLLFALVPLEAIIVVHFLLRDSTLEEAIAAVPWWSWSIALGLMLAGIALVPGTPDDFIYFQF
jgi:D-alanyl-lipoteichoic acid acyltransferase DltB (MBOAT superfamily)